jgi:signal-transduction protein with cAMP-binding, CBS, and nucleotidyltransferase domain
VVIREVGRGSTGIVRRRAHPRAPAAARGQLAHRLQEQFGVLRRLKFFHEFSRGEIWEVLRASHWQDYAAGEEIVKEGEMDDRFYILVTGGCCVERHGQRIGALDTGDCFGEASCVPGAKRTATIRAAGAPAR